MSSTITTTLLFLLLLFLLPSLHSLPLPPHSSFESSLIHQACLNTADYPSCTSRLLDPHQPNPTAILHAAARGAINEALRSIETVASLSPLSTTLRERAAVQDCNELLDLSVHQIAQSLSEIESTHDANLRSWLSAALTNQDTCLEGFQGTDGRLRHYVRGGLDEVTQLIGNLLEVYRRMRSIVPRGNETKFGSDGLPDWLTEDEMEVAADAVVAADGTGRFRTVGEAVEEAPSRSLRRYVIFVKRGVYKENVEIKRKKSNIMIVGEGMGVSVITGNRNFMQGWTTFRTATFGEFSWLVSWVCGKK